MPDQQTATPIRQTTSSIRPFLPALLLLFIGSGCAALIYEIVWFQLLQLAVGSSAISLGALLGTFMGGMCLGSLLLPRKVSPQQHPLRVYAWLEIGIGILGLVVLFAIPWVDRLYASIASFGMNGVFSRAFVAALCLLAPTLLMGASLPAIARWVESTSQSEEASQEGISWLGFFYGGNIAGAVFGCLLAGFYLLRVYDMAIATYVAVAINFAVGGLAWMLAERAPYTPSPRASQPTSFSLSGSPIAFTVIAISGMCALGGEVIWTRLLAMMIGATVYTFSLILAVFLVGLGLGSSAGALIARTSRRPLVLLGWTQLLAMFAIAWTAYMLAESVPYWPVNSVIASSPWFNFQIDLVRAFWTVLPPALFWGASFPLAMAAVNKTAEQPDPARVAGETYAANTVGAILGALAFSIFLVPWLGTQGAQRVLMGLAMVAAILALLPIIKAAASGHKTLPAVILILSIGGGIWLMRGLAPVPWLPLAYGRRAITTTDPGEPLYVGEGMNSSIVISQLPSGRRYFHVSGKVEASTEPFDMRLQRMLGHVSGLVQGDPKSVLIVGFGAGVTAGSFTTYPDMKKIVICEMEPKIPPAATMYFGAENYGVLNDPRTEVHYDDARHFILTTQQKFDVITSDPIHPWVKGAATLYSKEYFELVKQHLNPGGVVTQWVPLYESDLASVKSEIATFFEVFPNGTIWANNNQDNEGYDVVLLGQAEPTKIDVDKIQKQLDSPSYARVAKSLSDVGFASAIDMFATYAGREPEMHAFLRDAEINQDRSLRLQYLAGMGSNYQSATMILNEIEKTRGLPIDLFTGSQVSIARLFDEMKR
ncbi:MAG: fused MFS/spermidine synthase [Acidobacteriota bacterium]